MSKKSLYGALDVDNYEIRLLILQPEQEGSVLECELKTVNLLLVNDFSTLSYCWGDPTLTHEILVNNILTSVTQNLENALQRLWELCVTRLWVDALCINQEDDAEKSSQVRIMKNIYPKAAATYAWLGPAENDDAA